VTALGGWLVKSTGDGVLAVFPHPESAIESARRIRHLLAEMGIAIRAGIHTGRVETTKGDIRGLAVNIAARVMANSPDGQIAVSRSVRDLLLGSEYQLEILGSRRLRGVDGEWELYLLR
jgi:class 3 adenylate cyclase